MEPKFGFGSKIFVAFFVGILVAAVFLFERVIYSAMALGGFYR